MTPAQRSRSSGHRGAISQAALSSDGHFAVTIAADSTAGSGMSKRVARRSAKVPLQGELPIAAQFSADDNGLPDRSTPAGSEWEAATETRPFLPAPRIQPRARGSALAELPPLDIATERPSRSPPVEQRRRTPPSCSPAHKPQSATARCCAGQKGSPPFHHGGIVRLWRLDRPVPSPGFAC